ncbi:error-prone DNA polymerase [Arcanobacterium phocae]|uniref:error-prone DNA polymerase n=1 Tax=Arcanobacterium phocae TaxID=131112 RepID=UPI001C0F07CB|nr:error-prone DNA polymerase [Arcanobacterium phocae]
MSQYAELHVHSSYSFLTGAADPEELVRRAKELDISALALTDYDGFPGVIRFVNAAKNHDMPTVIGSEVRLENDNSHLVVLAKSAHGYRSLSHAIGESLLASQKKSVATYDLQSLATISDESWYVLTGSRHSHLYQTLEKREGIWGKEAAYQSLTKLADLFGKENIVIEMIAYGDPLDRERRKILHEIAIRSGIAYTATGDVHMAYHRQKPLADVLAATKHNTTLEQLRPQLSPTPQMLRSYQQMMSLHRDFPQAVEYAARLGNECAFDFSLITPKLPFFPVPKGHTEETWLRELVIRGAKKRYGDNKEAWQLIEYELDVINQLGFAGYFLIVDEIVNFCHNEGIWCQGRGSAANSAVCFALGITAVDAVKHKMLFERFLSPDRQEPPDIDVDIEAGQREKVIQHIYQRYGRRYAAQVSNVITYRQKSALRDSARALGYGVIDITRWSSGKNKEDLSAAIPQEVSYIARQMEDLPRHLGIHSGGMVLCDRPILDVCPVEWATKAGRTVVQWDKESCADAGLVKFDLLGLGMLTALRIAFTQIQQQKVYGTNGEPIGLHNIAQDDPRVYDLLCAADTVGVFQVESRAQMATLPRLRPRTFYDIVIEAALVRPGPIQGGSIHPYIARRRGREKVTYAHPLLRPALEKTLGIPLFQEQLMRIAIDTAGFTPAQADELRKAMSAKRSHERIAQLRDQLIQGMRRRGIDSQTAEDIFHKFDAFADFGFPESHAFSFAYLVYASAWLKVYYPEHFYAALLRSQPLGFYSPQSLVADARLHSINILPVDVSFSAEYSTVQKYDGTLISGDQKRTELVNNHPDSGVRLGLEHISGLGKASTRIIQARKEQPFTSLADLSYRAELSAEHIELLASAGALASLGITRREGIWAAESSAFSGLRSTHWLQPTIPGTETGIDTKGLPRMSSTDELVADFISTGITPFSHPIEIYRKELEETGIVTISRAVQQPVGTRIYIAGCITHRQRPRTAHGVTFISLEDETGMINVVCSKGFWAAHKDHLNSNIVVIRGVLEGQDGAVNFLADKAEKLHAFVPFRSRDFR